ncbi:MAG TPA: DUF1801 domain-containing protein [Parapedobacter sp.]|nr:DUF1801 domain-containing protein [Parapedobacter sp.]
MSRIDKYISQFDPEIQSRLTELRQLFLQVCPECEETIRYNMPAYKVGKHYLYFAAYKKHIGFYPVYGLKDLEEQLSLYRAKGTKDSLHFMHDKPLPIKLIKEIILLKSK